jgi:hypothetical protein
MALCVMMLFVTAVVSTRQEDMGIKGNKKASAMAPHAAGACEWCDKCDPNEHTRRSVDVLFTRVSGAGQRQVSVRDWGVANHRVTATRYGNAMGAFYKRCIKKGEQDKLLSERPELTLEEACGKLKPQGFDAVDRETYACRLTEDSKRTYPEQGRELADGEVARLESTLDFNFKKTKDSILEGSVSWLHYFTLKTCSGKNAP